MKKELLRAKYAMKIKFYVCEWMNAFCVFCCTIITVSRLYIIRQVYAVQSDRLSIKQSLFGNIEYKVNNTCQLLYKYIIS